MRAGGAVPSPNEPRPPEATSSRGSLRRRARFLSLSAALLEEARRGPDRPPRRCRRHQSSRRDSLGRRLEKSVQARHGGDDGGRAHGIRPRQIVQREHALPNAPGICAPRDRRRTEGPVAHRLMKGAPHLARARLRPAAARAVTGNAAATMAADCTKSKPAAPAPRRRALRARRDRRRTRASA